MGRILTRRPIVLSASIANFLRRLRQSTTNLEVEMFVTGEHLLKKRINTKSPINQSINQPKSESIPRVQSINQSINQSTNQSINNRLMARKLPAVKSRN